MNILTKEELKKYSKEFDVVEKYFDKASFLEKVEEETYMNLSNENKIIADEIIEFIKLNITLIDDLIDTDFYCKYLSRNWFYLLTNICDYIKEGYKDNLEIHYRRMDNYAIIVGEIDKLLKSKEKRKIKDIFLANELAFLSFLSLIDDIRIDDSKLLNIRRYKDEDNDMANIKKTVDVDIISLKTRNKNEKRSSLV